MTSETPTSFGFTLHGQDGAARTGEIAMPRGTIRTPAFMPVGTAATVKAMYADQVRDLGADVVLGNTYHLMLRPGAERMARLGGLHKFMQWSGPILTDSGGFQVMSLSALRKIDESGVTFRSHIDGTAHAMSPSAPSRSRACSAPTSRCSSMNACACPPSAPRSRRRCACRCAGPSAARWPSASSRGRRCSASCRAATCPTSAPRAPAPSWTSTSRATPSAASRWASRRR